MTVEEYLKFVSELKKIPKERRMSDISEVMELVKITDMSHRLIKNLSKGYRQRVVGTGNLGISGSHYFR